MGGNIKSAALAADPMSVIRRTLGSKPLRPLGSEPLWEINKLAIDRSEWTTPNRCKWATPDTRCLTNLATKSKGKTRRRDVHICHNVVSINSKTKYRYLTLQSEEATKWSMSCMT